MSNPKTLEPLRAEKGQAETQLALQTAQTATPRKPQQYYEKGERQKRPRRPCNLGGTIESLAPEVKVLIYIGKASV